MKVLILTEAGKGVGFGHLTRCLSLYGVFKEQGIIPKLIIKSDTSIIDILENTKYKIYNWLENTKKTLSLARKAEVVIIDSYLASRDLYRKIAKIAKVPVYLDDNKRIKYPDGIILNGNIYAKGLNYPKEKNMHYLLGIRYLPLRREFWKSRQRIMRKEVRNILLIMGGCDIRRLIPDILKRLTRLYPNVHKRVIVTGAFPDVHIRQIKKTSDRMTILIFSPGTGYLRHLMLASDIAISGAGQTLYELMASGLPTIAICLERNQQNNLKAFSEFGLCLSCGWAGAEAMTLRLENNLRLLFNDRELRKTMSLRQRKLIDGLGAKRVVNEILSSKYKSS